MSQLDPQGGRNFLHSVGYGPLECPRCGSATFRERYCARFCGWQNEEDVAPHRSGGWSEQDKMEYAMTFRKSVRSVRGASHGGQR